MIEDRYFHFLSLTGEPTAAAVLAAAEILDGQQQANPITPAAAAEILGVKVGKVYELCKAGKLRHQRIGRAVRLWPEEVKAFTERGTTGPPGPLRCLKTAS